MWHTALYKFRLYSIIWLTCIVKWLPELSLVNIHHLTRIPFFETRTLAAAAKSLQSCLTLCDPIDGSPPGSPVPGILQARTLEWGAISFSNVWKWKVKVKSLSRVQLLATPWTAAYQAPLSMGFFHARVLEWGAIAFSKPIMPTSSYSLGCPLTSWKATREAPGFIALCSSSWYDCFQGL